MRTVLEICDSLLELEAKAIAKATSQDLGAYLHACHENLGDICTALKEAAFILECVADGDGYEQNPETQADAVAWQAKWRMK